MDITPLPFRAGLELYKKQAKDVVKAFKSDDPEAMHCIRQLHPRLRGRAHTNDRNGVTDAEIRSAGLTLADAQTVIARWYGFESWPKLAEFVKAVTREGSPVCQFESAVEAIITGDVAALQSLLRDNPELVRARSLREHRATLLLYVGANLVEGYRQKSPKNAVKVAKILLKAGAEVDAVAQTGGSGTTLGQVATSVHPARAGVQIALMETLLDAGASVDGFPGGWNPLIAALHNGRGEAAEFLAKRGARIDLEGAAGVGRLDLVKGFFRKGGSLRANATKAQMKSGFVCACLYGRTRVVDFLLKKGVDLRAGENTGQTGLHCAAIGGHLGIIKSLLRHGAPLEARNVYGGTVLGQATWCVMNGDGSVDYVPIVATLLAAGAKAEEADYPTGNKRIDELLLRHGAKP